MRILQVSHDEGVQKTRELILKRVFPDASVVSVSNAAAAREACVTHDFQMVIIGQSLSEPEKVELEATVRTHCRGVKIVEIYHASPRTRADFLWEAGRDPAGFEKGIRALVM